MIKGSTALLVALTGLLAACGGAAGQPSMGDPVEATPAVERTPAPTPTPDPGRSLCDRASDLRIQLSELAAVPLRVSERPTIDDEWEEVAAAYLDLAETDPGALVEELAEPAKELRYRQRDLELAVEDFRTTPNPARAARHMQAETAAFSEAIAEFERAAGCLMWVP